eukprot:4938885-Heterocapsa_arctica.AAC.1
MVGHQRRRVDLMVSRLTMSLPLDLRSSWVAHHTAAYTCPAAFLRTSWGGGPCWLCSARVLVASHVAVGLRIQLKVPLSVWRSLEAHLLTEWMIASRLG